MQNFCTWDGTFIGEIDKDKIIKESKLDKYDVIELINDELMIVTKYKTNIPLILDELKPLFNIKKLGRNSAMLKGKKVILTKITKDCKIFNSEEFFEEDIRLSYYFRYMVGLIQNTDKTLIISDRYITSFKEDNIDFNKSDLTKVCFKKWFENDWYDIKEMTLDLTKNKMLFKFKLDEVIMRIDDEYLYLSFKIIDRMNQLI